MPKAITLLFREVCEAFLPLEGKPSDNDLTTIWETLLPVLMEIPYNQLKGEGDSLPHGNPHKPGRYAAEHGGSAFV